MRKLMMVLVAAGLLICAASYGRAESSADKTKPDKFAVAKMNEEKGDLARAHSYNETAVVYYRTALRIDRKNAKLYNKVGVVELQLRDHKAARKDFERALNCDPQFATAINNLGAVAFLDRKYTLAVHYLKQSLALDELNASTHVNLAEAWVALGDMDRAMTEYARALELNADIMTTRQDGVLTQISTPEQRARVSFMIAKAYAKRGNIEGALEYLRRAKDGRFPDLHKVYSDPDFASLLQDPRLAKIVKK